MDCEYDYDAEQYYDIEQMSDHSSLKQDLVEEDVNEEGSIQGIKQQSSAHQMIQAPKKLVDPANVQDIAFDFLISESNWKQIEETLQSDPDMYFVRLGKIFNYIVNIIYFTEGQEELLAEYMLDLQSACKIFIESSYIGEHSELRNFTDPTIQILLKVEKKLLGTLVTMLLPNPQKLTPEQVQLRGFIPRLLIMLACPSDMYLSTLGARETQAYVLQRMEKVFLSGEVEYFESQWLDIVGYIFYCDPTKHTVIIRNIIQVLSAFLESFLESEDQAQKTQVQISILNIIQLFVVLTQNEQLNADFYVNQLYKNIYQAIKYSTPVFAFPQNNKVWAKEPMIRKSMVSLICRILSGGRVDENLIQILLDDFLFLIEKQKFDFIQSVILPILNSESVQYQPLCIHSPQPIAALTEYRTKLNNFFRHASYTQNQSQTLRFKSDLLSFDQRVVFGRYFSEFARKESKVQTKKQYKVVKKKEKSTQEIDINLYDVFKQGSEEKEHQQTLDQMFQEVKQVQMEQIQQNKTVILIPSDGEVDQLQKELESPLKMEIEQIDPQLQEVAGRWQCLHTFSPQNPTMTYQSVLDAISEKSNLLFIFDLISNYQNCKICIFVEGVCNQGEQPVGIKVQPPSFLAGGNNHKQCNATQKSFFSLFADEKHFYSVPALKEKTQSYVMLDLQQAGLNIVHRSEIVAYVNFGNLNMSKFGFPFKELSEKSFEIDQLQTSMSSEENFLLGAEIWHFNPQYSTLQDLVIDSQLSQFSQHKTMAELVTYYTSQFRLETIHFVPEQATIGELTNQLKKQGYEGDEIFMLPGRQQPIHPQMTLAQLRQNKNKTILDVYLMSQKLDTEKINLTDQVARPKNMLRYFEQQIGGMVKIAHMLRKELVRKQQNALLEFFNDMMDLIQLPGYIEEILQHEEFLQLMLGIVFFSQQQQLFHKGILYLYKALLVILQKMSQYRQSLILTDYYSLLLKRACSYMDSLHQDGEPDTQPIPNDKLKELFAEQKLAQIPIKGKPKGVGYGDINYNANKFKTSDVLQSQPISKDQSQIYSNELYGPSAENYKLSIVSVILNCLSLLLTGLTLTQDSRDVIQSSRLFTILKTLFVRVNISDITQQEELYYAALSVVKQLAKYEELLDLFVSDVEKNSLYRMIEGLREQAEIFKQTFREQENVDQDGNKQTLLQTFGDTLAYLELRLVAASLITISHEQPMMEEEQKQSLGGDAQLNLHQFYTILMKPLAIGKCSSLRQDKDWSSKMDTYVKASAATPSSIKMNRLIQELTDLGNALPIESSNSIFVRYDQDRMDVMRAIIFGAAGTPYAHGAFQYELLFMDDYPNRPPKVLLSTTGHGKFRFNPNLYACGKVCLSLLGTWGDNWIANVSTILQILVSIMSMVMSEYVMFNEPGWEAQMSTAEGQSKNQGYCNLVKLSNIRYAMIDQLRTPPLGFEDVIKKSFYLRKDLVCQEIELWIKQADLPANYTQTQNQCPYAAMPTQYKVDLQLAYNELKVELEKLKLSIGRDFSLTNGRTIKRIITVNNKRDYTPSQKAQLLQKYAPAALPLPQPVVYDIDTSYSQSMVQKAFDPTDAHVQNLMSRYIGVLGVDAITKQSEASVLIVGLGALGVETAKNIILSGVKRLTLWDDRVVQASDQCGQFYLWQQDIGSKRSQATISKLKHLNPYVMVDFLEGDPLPQIEACLHQYSVVVVTDDSLAYDDLISLGRQCRAKNVGIIHSQSLGVYARIVVDLGAQFPVLDKDGETPSEVNIESISAEGVVHLFKNQNHNIQDGDTVIFQEIVEDESSLKSLNDVEFVVQRVTRTSFEIGDTRQGFNRYIRNGVGHQQKRKAVVTFAPLEQAMNVDAQFADLMGIQYDEVSLVRRDLLNLLFSYKLRYGGEMRPWSLESTQKFFDFVMQCGPREALRKKYEGDVFEKYADQLVPVMLLFSLTHGGVLPALDALMGAITAQEVLKAITKKYSPIQQVYLHVCDELLPFPVKELQSIIQFDTVTNQLKCDAPLLLKFINHYGFLGIVEECYRPLQILLGVAQLNKLRQAKLFMVGCGAIGCELLKNFAMNGLSNYGGGCIYVTDPDIIENSNLSRQFLFREQHIRKPKAVTAAAVAKQMNPYMNVIARLDRACPDTTDIYHTQFYQQLDCVANALDNVKARLYVDGRCVESDVALVESGTLGPKGHVQVVLPHLTESYGSRRDPEEDNDIPYCTLKMFPESALHCLEWGRDKFESYFVRKPQAVAKVVAALASAEPVLALQQIQQQTLELALRCLKKLPLTFEQCIYQARVKYERLFNANIVQLMTAYPCDTKDGSGKLFWSAPKRPPKVLNFDQEGKWAILFVHDYAVLLAQCYHIQLPSTDLIAHVAEVVKTVQVPQFQLSKQKMALMKKQVEKNPNQMEVEQPPAQQNSLDQLISDLQAEIVMTKCPQPQQFEKDDDTNHHISFIASSTNARARNYGIAQVDWLWCKLKAGRIVPAMATTTACISALQTIEIIKVLTRRVLDDHKNTFTNLAIPCMMQSEPGPCDKVSYQQNFHQIKINNQEVSIWSKHPYKLTQLSIPLLHFVQDLEETFKLPVISIKYGAKPIYLAQMLPTDALQRDKFLGTPLLKLLDWQQIDYLDLDVTFKGEFTDLLGPRVRLTL